MPEHKERKRELEAGWVKGSFYHLTANAQEPWKSKRTNVAVSHVLEEKRKKESRMSDHATERHWCQYRKKLLLY